MRTVFETAITELKNRQFISAHNNFSDLAKNERNQFKSALYFLLAAECKKRQEKPANKEILEAGESYIKFGEKNKNIKGKTAYLCAAKCFSQIGKYEDATKAINEFQKIIISNEKNDLDIIIIDDSEAITIRLENILKKLGHENIQSFNLGKDAVEKSSEFLKLKNPIILLDIGLPDISGNKVSEKLLEKKPDLKIIVITADEKTSKETHATISRGVSAYIQKPFSLESISKTLDKVVSEDSIMSN